MSVIVSTLMHTISWLNFMLSQELSLHRFSPLYCGSVTETTCGFGVLSVVQAFSKQKNSQSTVEIVSVCCKPSTFFFFFFNSPEGRPGRSDFSPLSGISGLSFDSTLLSPLLFFCLVLLPFLSYRFLPAGPFF